MHKLKQKVIAKITYHCTTHYMNRKGSFFSKFGLQPNISRHASQAYNNFKNLYIKDQIKDD